MAYLSALTDQQNMCLSELSNLAGYLSNFKKWSIGDIPDDPDGILAKCRAAGLGDIGILDTLDDNVQIDGKINFGLKAIFFADINSNVGFSFAGTDGLPDLLNMIEDLKDDAISQILSQSIQVQMAEQFFLNVKDGAHADVYLYGLSHGGLISQILLSLHDSMITEIHIQNSQNASQINANPEKINAIRTEEEILRYLDVFGQYHRDDELGVEGSGGSWHRHGYDGTNYNDGYAKGRNIRADTNKMGEYVYKINDYIKLLDSCTTSLRNAEKNYSISMTEIKPGSQIGKPQDKLDFSFAYTRIRQAISICQHTQEYLNTVADKLEQTENSVHNLFN